jgi:hypothetical protein
MTFRPGGNRDLRSIARVLGVANVVEGTVRRENNRVRIPSDLSMLKLNLLQVEKTQDNFSVYRLMLSLP